MAAWTKLPPWTGVLHQSCSCCPPTEPRAPMDMIIAVGFGSAVATRDGVVVADGEDMAEKATDADDWLTLEQVEAMAAADPDHDWRVSLQGPLRGREYQRHGAGEWVLTHSDEGFA